MPNYLVMSKGRRNSLFEPEVLDPFGQSENTYKALVSDAAFN
jgi:hypothetical protein